MTGAREEIRGRILLTCCLYWLLCLSALLLWQNRSINDVTGDEPHYLIISQSLASYGSLELTRAYEDEFASHQLVKEGLAAPGTPAADSNTHAAGGANGRYSFHNIGLPLLLTIPFALGGVWAAKLFMVLLSTLGVLLSWRIALHAGLDRRLATLGVLALTAGLPLVPAAGQIYPDVLAGSIALAALYWLHTPRIPRRLPIQATYALAVAFLPWLQIKLSATALVLAGAGCWVAWHSSASLLQRLAWPVLLGGSLLLLASYNFHAFGKISGPYSDGALELSTTTGMVLLGLLLDQNQGMLLQNPLLWLGILYLPGMLRKYPVPTLFWGLTFCSLVVPNAMHPNWYGGLSFSGRFGWSAALVLFLPTMAALKPLQGVLGRNKLILLLLTLITLQLTFFFKYAYFGVSLYNRPAANWLSEYSALYRPLQNWVPALYNIDWAGRFAPNYLFTALLLFVLAYGAWLFARQQVPNRPRAGLVVIAYAMAVAITGYFSKPGDPSRYYPAGQMPSLTGRTAGSERIAISQQDAPGFLSFGPYVGLSRGTYEVTLKYLSPAPEAIAAATFDIFHSGQPGEQKQALELVGTDGKARSVCIRFNVSALRASPYEFRVLWNGQVDMRLQGMTLTRLD
ncbi:hypothetical protein ACAW63_05285 [Pseudomonas sp. QE6]|uniref:hypothetical protein n=1 Tax=Pseudomonas sp. QE6 TaxID=3242491 RepID=UPI003529019F